MVVLSIEAYSKLVEDVEHALDEADYAAEKDDRRMTHEDVFDALRRKLDG